MKTFLESIKGYLAIFMSLVAAVTFIWTLGVKSERKSSEDTSNKKDITEIKISQKEETKKLDSLIVIVNLIKQDQSKIVESQDAMRNSYVNYLSNQKTLTKEDFLKYMNGLEFQITPSTAPADKTKFNIGVKKMKDN